MSRKIDCREVTDLDKLIVPRNLLDRLIDASVVSVEDGVPISLDPITLGYRSDDENGIRRLPSLEEMPAGLRERWEASVMEKMGLGTIQAREIDLTRVVVDPAGSGDKIAIYKVPKNSKVRHGGDDTEGLRLYAINRDGGKDLLVGPATRKRGYGRILGWLVGEVSDDVGRKVEESQGRVVEIELGKNHPSCEGCVLAGKVSTCRV